MRRLAILLVVLVGTGALEARQGALQAQRGVSASQDRDPRSFRLMAITTWPAGLLALTGAFVMRPQPALGRHDSRRLFVAGLAMTGVGVGLRQWSIRTLGRFFVGRVSMQPGHRVVRTGPYRWLRHPSYTGLLLQFAGLGLATGNAFSLATCLLLPSLGVVRRLRAEEAMLRAELPDDYPDYARTTRRLIPFVW